GSSHMWMGFDAGSMQEKYGISAYNYGCNWQHLNTTELFIKDSFRTQSPKVILVELFKVNHILQDVGMEGEIYYTRAISEFEGKREYLKQCFGEDKERFLAYYMPLCAFHENWPNINIVSFVKRSYGDFHKTKGAILNEIVVPITIADHTTFEQLELNDDSIKVLDNIVEICKENGTEIIFYVAPYASFYNYSDAMTKYAQENDCVFLDMYKLVDDIGLDENTDFCDSDHLNKYGAYKVADYLGKYIVEIMI
ncbi:MAG: SGNH/GDSL hydrolase family protein, partial [Oscillospiraceae bacterium]|nr:SGNH/GDSL hydrolase family protein [Oscillospiraceae bacterium]